MLIQVRASSVNPLDLFAMRGPPLIRLLPGPRTPPQKILGCDIAGQVEAVGRRVTQFQPGDDVFGVKGFAGGAFAEYACVPEDKLVRMPANRSFEEAAAVPVAALAALQGLRDKGRIQPGQKVLVDGASGGVGTFAVQIAKSFGAEVTAVCSTRNVDTARCLKDLLDAGRVAPVIDRCYPLSDVADALRYLEEGHARGKVIVTVQPLTSVRQPRGARELL